MEPNAHLCVGARANWGTSMHDPDYLRALAARYRKLARTFEHAMIRERLQSLADDLEDRFDELQQPHFELALVGDGEHEALN